MVEDGKILLGAGEKKVYLDPGMACRHGLIAGASGTGKTTTVRVLAESFSMLSVPVFLADVKGDLGGMCLAGEDSPAIRDRLKALKFTQFTLTDFPCCFWDVYGESGIPIRTTVSEMGPELLSDIMGLNDVQRAVLKVVFHIADDEKLLLIDIKDLKEMLRRVSDKRKEYSSEYANISSQSIGAIQRQILTLQDEGGDLFFGEPAIDIDDFMSVDARGRGVVNILNCSKLYLNRALYSAFMLFLLSELFETLPEVGDLDKPKLVFFFDEASVLFENGNKALAKKIEQVARLKRSKGVGVYFITQSPGDIPDAVLAQLSNRVQHALRAYTPTEQKKVTAAADSFRANPAFDTATAITQLGVGAALSSCLDASGVPTPVERAVILPPQSRFAVPDESRIKAVIAKSEMCAKYQNAIDRESAYELLSEKARLEEREKLLEQKRKQDEKLELEREKELEKKRREDEKLLRPVKSAATATLNSIGRQLGRELVRGLFGTGKRRW